MSKLNNESAFSHTSRFSQKIASTAQTLVSSDLSLISSPAYTNAISDITGLNKSTQLQRRNQQTNSTSFSEDFDQDLRRKNSNKTKKYSNARGLFGFTSQEVWKSKLSKKEIEYKALTRLSDELLNDLPPTNKNDSFSLYQGFEASLPDINDQLKSIYNAKNKNKNAKLLTNGTTSNGSKALILTNNEQEQEHEDDAFDLRDTNFENYTFKDPFNSNKIHNSKSLKKLYFYKDNLDHKVDLLEIRKNLASSEIRELDAKIVKLQSMRGIVFRRVANLEQEQIMLENHRPEIEEKIEELIQQGITEDTTDIDDDVEIENDNNKTEDKDDENSFEHHRSTSLQLKNNEDFNDLYQPENEFLSQSIYTKLQKSPSLSSTTTSTSTPIKKKNSFFQKRKQINRKIKPTLQNFCKPGESINKFKSHSNSITCLDFNIPFGTLITASLDNTVKVWDLSAAAFNEINNNSAYKKKRKEKIKIGELNGHESYVKCMHMEDNIVVTGSADNTLKLWELENLNMDDDYEEEEECCIYTFRSHVDEITALYFNGYNLVSGSKDKTIRQWDMHTGKCLQTLDVLWAASNIASPTSSTLPVINNIASSSLNYEQNDDFDVTFIGALQCFDAALASGTADGIIRLWDLRTGQVHRSLIGHTAPITTLQFDERHLITGSIDKSIRIWDLRMGSIVDHLNFDSGIINLQFDSRRIVCSTMNDSTVKIYDRATEKLWECGDGVNNENSEFINYVRYREGYLVEGKRDGTIGSWAC